MTSSFKVATSRYFRVFWGDLQLIMSLKLENGNVEIPLLINYCYITNKMILNRKTTFIQAICHLTWKTLGTLFSSLPKCTPSQSCPFVSIHASLSFYCISFIMFNSFKWLLQCFILLFGHFQFLSWNYIILRDIASLKAHLQSTGIACRGTIFS